MSQVLQVLDIFEIWIFQIFEFSGSQKWPALAASMTMMETIYIVIIYNFYLIVNSRRRWDLL